MRQDRRPCGPRFGARLALAAGCVMLLAACGQGGGANPSRADGDTQSPTVANTQNGVRPSTQTSSGTTSIRQTPVAVDLDASGWMLQPPFYAGGDEPYWRLELIDGWFVFRRSGLPEIEAPIAAPTRDGATEVFEAPPLQLSLKSADCSLIDGGGSPFAATVVFDETVYQGCAYSGSFAGAASSDTERVARAVLAVDACLAQLGEPALVTGVYPREGGLTALGLRLRNGSLYECGAEANGAVAFLDPIEQGAAAAWMTSRMRFLRDDLVPGYECEDGEVVTDGAARLGLLLTPRCRF